MFYRLLEIVLTGFRFEMRFFLFLFCLSVHQLGITSSPAVAEKKRISVIINPISGGSEKEKLAQEITEHLGSIGYDVETLFTQAPCHATQLAEEALRRHVDILAVVGGDGTVNEVGQAMIGRSTALAIIPMGSGNGLARHLHIPLVMKDAIALIEKGHTKTIDTVRVNDRFVFSVAGIGFDAEVGWSFAQATQRGFFSYFIITLKILSNYRASMYELTLDGKKIERTAFLISFANSSEFGNGATISPEAQISDGLLDVVIMKKFPFYAVFEMVYRLFHRSLHHSKYVEIIRCKEIDIAASELKAHIDGEPVIFHDGMHVQVIPSSLKIIVP